MAVTVALAPLEPAAAATVATGWMLRLRARRPAPVASAVTAASVGTAVTAETPPRSRSLLVSAVTAEPDLMGPVATAVTAGR